MGASLAVETNRHFASFSRSNLPLCIGCCGASAVGEYFCLYKGGCARIGEADGACLDLVVEDFEVDGVLIYKTSSFFKLKK